MRGFHIDMNGLLYKKEYLKQWLTKIKADGYDTILWELENGVQWETCPESNDSDALSKKDFKDLLKHTKEIGLESIPLLQTIGHAEYVLKNKEYHHLAENVAEHRQYCPLNPTALEFIHSWINEYLDLFGTLRYFHIGADEAYDLGFCPKCQQKSQASSLSELYIDYINSVISPILKKNITPIIWGDMILHHHEALEKLDKRIMIYDWIYSINKNSEKIHIWGDGYFEPSAINERAKKAFSEFIFPKNCTKYDSFYTSAFLTKNNFKTVICPASSSYGDNVFSPANFHLANCFDLMQKSSESHLEGFLLTSWTVHLLPWELQNICIAMNKFLIEKPKGTLQEYQTWYSKNILGLSSDQFWKACEIISTPLPLALTRDIGHSKDNFVTPKDAILKSIEKYLSKESKQELVDRISKQEKELTKAIRILENLQNEVSLNQNEIKIWLIAGNNLLNRAKAGLAIINNNAKDKEELIPQTIALKEIYKNYFADHLQPKRLKDTTDRLFDPLIFALQN
jgi:hypothetical protein